MITQAFSSSREPSMRNQYVDFDTHVYDPITIWHDYLDPQFRDRSPRWIERDGRLMVDVAGKAFPSAPDHPGYRKIYGEDSKVDRTGNDPAERLRYMDGKGSADIQVIFPTLGLAGFPGSVDDPALAAAFTRAYNRYISEFTSIDRRRLRATMLIPANHPELAAQEMRWAKEAGGLDLVALTPTPPGDLPWSHTSRDPIWHAASDLGVKVLFHETTAGCLPNAIGIGRYRGHWPLTYLVTHVLEAQLAFADVILGGTLERFPKLRVGACEAHVHWVAGWLSLMDQNFGAGRKIFTNASGEVELSLKPSEYFRRQCLVAAFPEDTMIAEALAAAPESIVVCSDWPHPIAEEHSYNGIPAVLHHRKLNEAQKQALLIDNPTRFL
jgi:predicted TIM-barrel fold metal-dependent hydrolase